MLFDLLVLCSFPKVFCAVELCSVFVDSTVSIVVVSTASCSVILHLICMYVNLHLLLNQVISHVRSSYQCYTMNSCGM